MTRKLVVPPGRLAECFNDDGLFVGHENADKALAAGDSKRSRLILLLSELLLEQRMRIVSKLTGHAAQVEVLACLAEWRGEVLRRLEKT